MYIEKINGPEDVKKLSGEELKGLAQEMRDALLKRASIHGGHFGPNFGMVEATLPFIMCLNHQRTRLSMMYPIRRIRTKC